MGCSGSSGVSACKLVFQSDNSSEGSAASTGTGGASSVGSIKSDATQQMNAASSGMSLEGMEQQAKKLRNTIARRRKFPESTGKPKQVNNIVGHYEVVLQNLENQIDQLRKQTQLSKTILNEQRLDNACELLLEVSEAHDVDPMGSKSGKGSRSKSRLMLSKTPTCLPCGPGGGGACVVM